MKSMGFENLYFDCLRDLYDAEQQITKALPKMIKMASSPELKKGLEEHLKVTEGQAKRIEQIFQNVDEEPTGERCRGMSGLIQEGEEVLKKLKGAEPNIIDAAIIANAQKVEHYEICGYGTARTFARYLNDTEGQRLLEQTLEEEKKADKELTAIAESNVNVKAAEVAAGAK